MQKLQDELGKWSDETFGASRSPIGSINHMKEECDELLEDPYDLYEYADVLHLLLDSVRKAGYTTEDLMMAAWNKLEVNKNRTWGEPDEFGVVRHIK